MNESWPKWVKASIAKYFSSGLPTEKFLLEGDDATLTDDLPRYELRINGPDINKLSKNTFKLEVGINILVVSLKSKEDLYKHEKQVGKALVLFTSNLPLYKYGDAAEDTGAFWACLSAVSEINVINGGESTGTPVVVQSAIECQYKVTLNA